MSTSLTASWSLREATGGDARWIAELRAVVLRPDLERLSRFDPVRVRQRFLAAFEPALTRVVQVQLASGPGDRPFRLNVLQGSRAGVVRASRLCR